MKYINNILRLLILTIVFLSSCKEKIKNEGFVRGMVIVLDSNGNWKKDYDCSLIKVELKGNVDFLGEAGTYLHLEDTCDRNGAYKFENLNYNSPYELSVSSLKFLPRVKMITSDGIDDTLILRVVSPLRIVCSVEFPNSEPASNTDVYLYSSSFIRDQDTFCLRADRPGKTDVQGNVVFEGLTPGTYYFKSRYEFNKSEKYEGTGGPIIISKNFPDKTCPIKLKKQ